MPANNNPYCHDVKIGVAFEYRRGGEEFGNGRRIAPRLLSVPSISKELSDIYNARVIFSGGVFELNNGDGFFDTLLEDEEIIGNKAKSFIRHPVTGVKQQSFSGFVEGGSVRSQAPPVLKLRIKDDKESLNIPIPRNVFNLTDYPYLHTDNVDKPIPLAFGHINNVELICSNELEPAAGTFYFPCADTSIGVLHDVDSVRVDDVDVAFTKDLANNRFSLSSAVYTPGQKVTATIQGYENASGDLMNNACDILKFLFMTFFGFTDNTDFFDTWDTVHAFNIFLWINEIKKFWEIVEIICKSSFINLILNNNGSYTALVNNRDGFYLREIRNYEVVEGGEIEYDSTKILSSVLVKYAKDHDGDKFKTLLVNDNESAMFDVYNQYYFKEFESNIDNATDARNYGLIILDYFSTSHKPVKIKMDYFEADDLILGLNYKLVLSRPKFPTLGAYVVKVIKIEELLNDAKKDITLQLIEKIPDTISVPATIWNDCFYNSCFYSTGRKEIV